MKQGIKIGDYLLLGKYQKTPILWRCIGFHKMINGNSTCLIGLNLSGHNALFIESSDKQQEGYAPLFLADKVLCTKVFDGIGDNLSGSHGRGEQYDSVNKRSGPYSSSVYWGDSNIRSWLNSRAKAGSVDWLCGNPPTANSMENWNQPYDDEQGFLRSFTAKELKLIRPVSQPTELAPNEYQDMTPYACVLECPNIEKHSKLNRKEYITEPQDRWTIKRKKKEEKQPNAYQLYIDMFTDLVFLLDPAQFNTLVSNSDILGLDYRKAVSLEEPDECQRYWLRSPSERAAEKIMAINNVGAPVVYGPDASMGIRPAFYLNNTDLSQLIGAGTIESPYTLDNNHFLKAVFNK